MLPYIIILIIIIIFKLNTNLKNIPYKNKTFTKNKNNIKNNSIWEDTKLYDEIMNNKINISYKNQNPNILYNPMANLEYYKTPWNYIETVPLDYLSKYNENIKIIYNAPYNQFTELIQKK